MKLALVDGERREPSKGLIGSCIGCDQPMIPKCGPIKIHHWAHKSDCECDHWWENETVWHRAWKNHFPPELQEIRHKDETTGEWHIADVKTKHGHILEFQHSFLKDEERQARNKFYGDKLVWIVDGLKRVKDKSQFELFLKHAIPIQNDSSILKLHPFINECSLINEWSNCSVPVFFDFGPELPLWCLLPKSAKGNYYILEYSRQNFLALHTELLNGKTFEDFTKFVNGRIIAYENPELVKAMEAVQAPQQTVMQVPQVRYARISLNDLRWLERQIGRMPQPKYNNRRSRRF
jgi:competence protein CoiA